LACPGGIFFEDDLDVFGLDEGYVLFEHEAKKINAVNAIAAICFVFIDRFFIISTNIRCINA